MGKDSGMVRTKEQVFLNTYKMRYFFNTTQEDEPVRKVLEDKAKSQNEKVMAIFRRYRSMGASECWRIIHNQWLKDDKAEGYAPPITSIRRSITVLTTEGKLERSPKKVTGMYGRPEFIYTLTD